MGFALCLGTGNCSLLWFAAFLEDEAQPLVLLCDWGLPGFSLGLLQLDSIICKSFFNLNNSVISPGCP